MKFTIILAVICFALTSTSPCAAQRPMSHTGLHPARESPTGRYGYIDRTGRFRIPPQFVQAFPFSDGVACVELDGDRRGIINATVAFTPLSQCGPDIEFHEGLARFSISVNGEEKFGFVDTTGRILVEPQFSVAGHFSEGLAWVGNEVRRRASPLNSAGLTFAVDGRYGFVDRTGRIVIPMRFNQRLGNFSEGLAEVRERTRTGFIDRTGAFRIPARFRRTALGASFSEGLAAVIEGGTERFGELQGLIFIDRDGNVVFRPPRFDERRPAQGESVTIPEIRIGNLLSASTLSLVHYRFSENLAPVPTNIGIGFVDRRGEIVIRPQFCCTSGFSEGLAAVQIINEQGRCSTINDWGYIDRTGRFVIEPRFSAARPFTGGLAVVQTREDTWHYIDQTGRMVWNFRQR